MPRRGASTPDPSKSLPHAARFLLYHLFIFLGAAVILTWFFVSAELPFEDYLMAMLTFGALFVGIAGGHVAGLLTALVLIFAYGSIKVGLALWLQQQGVIDASRLFWLAALPMAAYLGGSMHRLCASLSEKLQGYMTTMDELVVVDPSTGLETSRRFAFRVDEELARTRRYGGVFSLLLVKISFLRELEDVHGARTLDLVLKKIAETLSEQKRTEDFLAMLGEGEFAYLLPATAREGVLVMRQRLKQKITTVDLVLDEDDFRRIRISSVTGLACFPVDGGEYVSLLATARKDYEYDHD